jgi:hypothetical protein
MLMRRGPLMHRYDARMPGENAREIASGSGGDRPLPARDARVIRTIPWRCDGDPRRAGHHQNDDCRRCLNLWTPSKQDLGLLGVEWMAV